MTYYDLDQVRAMVSVRVRDFGTQAAYAQHLGMLPQQLNRALRHRASIDVRILDDLGLRKETVYCTGDPTNGRDSK